MMEHEPPAAAARAGFDFADEEYVIAGAMPRVMPALEPGDAAIDQRSVRGAEAVGHAREAIDVRPRETTGQRDLVVGEHVDRVTLRRLKRREAARAPMQAPDNERRIERNRVERVRREADIAAVTVAHGNHGDTGRELRERVAELPVGKRGGCGARAIVGSGRRQEGSR